MKYNRLTKRIANDEEAFLFHSSLHEGIERLAELEDKIESGELCEREEIRKETAIEIIEILKSYDEENYLQEVENIIAKKYGVEVEDEQ